MRRNQLADLHSAYGNQAVLRFLQSSQPNSADGAASGLLQRKCACGGGGADCAECRKKETDLQRKPASSKSGSSKPAAGVPAIVHDVLRSSGRPLDAATRAFFEPRFGRDFSGVRIHTDSQAAESARAVNALAYTVGRNVVFGAGSYQPASTEGDRLLAHELAHVVQQSGRQSTCALRIADLAGENAAEQAASRVMQSPMSSPMNLAATGMSGVLQRACPKPPTGMGSTPSSEPCDPAAATRVSGLTVLFCQDSTQFAEGQEMKFAEVIVAVKAAAKVEIHGNASTEGPGGDYNSNLACKRAAAAAARLRAAGVTAPIKLISHGPTTAYGSADKDRNVTITLITPAAVKQPQAPAAPSPTEQAVQLGEQDCATLRSLLSAHQKSAAQLFLQVYMCLSCSFAEAYRAGVFEDPLWLARVNHLAVSRLGPAFSSHGGAYKGAFGLCDMVDDCADPKSPNFSVFGCSQLFSDPNALSLAIFQCVEDIGMVHLGVDLRDALKSTGCSMPANKRDYAKVVPLFKDCNIAALGGILAKVFAIPKITSARNAAWTDAGCP
ncbi:MAG TPA: DUF4157 domain-containing protein [Terriglobales bacterium]|nr:DUF4157 domain-containing protein [Terriglobales bacterium]